MVGQRLAAVAALSLVVAALASPPPALAGPAWPGGPTVVADGTVLPLDDYSALAVDTVHGREFVSGSPLGDPVVVADRDGRVQRELTGLKGASDVMLSPDDKTLYVALPHDHGVALVDTSTFTVRHLDVGSGTCPSMVTPAAGLVWFYDRCHHEGGEVIGSLDPATAAVHTWPVDLLHGAGLRSSPALPGQLLTASGRFAVTGGAHPTLRAVSRAAAAPGTVVANASGTRLLTGSELVDSRTSEPLDSYPYQTADQPAGGAVGAVRGDGEVAVGGAEANLVHLYAPGQTIAGASYIFRGVTDGGSLAALAFGRGDLYAVTAPSGQVTGGGVVLHVLPGAVPLRTWVGQRSLPLLETSSLVADPTHDRAFVTGGVDQNGVVVVDRHGRIEKVLQHLPGAAEMSLSADRRTLYVALAGTDALAAIDTRTLRARRIATGRGTCPTNVAVTAGLVWFDNCPDSQDRLDAVDPRTGRVHHGLLDLSTDQLLATPALGDVLIATPVSSGHGLPERVLVAGGRHPSARVERTPLPLPGTTDVTLSRDGTTIVSGLADAQAQVAQSSGTLAVTGLVPTEEPVVAVAVRDDGLTAAGTQLAASDATADPGKALSIRLSRQAVGPAVGGIRMPTGGLRPRGLGFGARDLFALVHVDGGQRVQVLRMPAVRVLSVATDREVYESGSRVRAVAHLDATGRAVRRQVAVYARTYGRAHRRLVARGRTDRFGNLHTGLRVDVRTRLTLTAAPGGGLPAEHVSTLVVPGVRLRDQVTDLAGVTTSHDHMPAGARPALLAQVAPAHAGQCLSVEVDRLTASRGWRRVGHAVCRRLDDHGRARLVLPDRSTLGGATQIRVQARWAGDVRNAPVIGPWHEVTFD